MTFDLAIIGGGPAGFFAAEYGKTQGLNIVIFEKDELGGVCINDGCIPAKSFLHSVQAFSTINSAAKAGIISECNFDFDMTAVMAKKKKAVSRMQNLIKQKLSEDVATLVYGHAYIKKRLSDGNFEMLCNNTSYFAKHLLICSGSRPEIPNIPGINSPAVCTYNALLQTPSIPKKIVMIGGGSINIELAHAYRTLGSEIVILEESSEILPDTDSEICTILRGEYEKQGIAIHLNTRISKIDGNTVFFATSNTEQQIDGDVILCDIGRVPNLENFGLENLDVECYRKGIRVNNQMQTSEKNVYAAGDVTGFSKSAHAAYCESAVIINTIMGISDQMNFKAISNCIFSNPEVASVGITEDSLKLAWMPHKIIRLPLTQSSKYIIQNEEFEGLCKMIIGEDDTILGVHMIGNNCIESILAAVMAVEARMTITQWRKIVFPYPTIGEIMKGALIYAQTTNPRPKQ